MQLLTVLVALMAGQPTERFFTTSKPVDVAGQRAVCDLPASQHMQNTGGSDGLGLCVFTSAEVTARWQGITELDGFQRYMRSRPGGGWPQKLDQEIRNYCRMRGVPTPQYVQHTGGDEEFLDAAIKTGRMPCVTYAGNDGFYRGLVAHMVNLTSLTDQRASIVDNNRAGKWVFMSRNDYLTRWRQKGGGWAVVFLDPAPPLRIKAPEFIAGQCANGVCRVPGRALAPIPTPDSYRWEGPIQALDGTIWRLYRNGQHVGAWYGNGYHELRRIDQDGEHYQIIATGSPVDPPAGSEAVAADAVYPDGGVVPEKIDESQRKYYLNGVEVGKRECLQAIADSSRLPNDTDSLHITAVGTADEIRNMRAAFDALPASDREKCRWQDYLPGRWEVSEYQLPYGLAIRRPVAGSARDGVQVVSMPVQELTPQSLAAAVASTLRPQPPAPPPSPEPPKPGPNASPDSCLTIRWHWAIFLAVVSIYFILATKQKG